MHSEPAAFTSSLGLRNSAGALACAAAACLAAHARADPVAYRVDPQATRVEYTASALGIFKQRGSFSRVRGLVTLDRDSGSGRVDFTIDARSLGTGWELSDAFVQDEPLLDASRHPSIRFQSTLLRFGENGLAGVVGELTLRGVTHPIELNVTRFACGAADDKCEADASATIRRSAFGMERYAPLIDDDVDLVFTIVARRAPPAAVNSAAPASASPR